MKLSFSSSKIPCDMRVLFVSGTCGKPQVKNKETALEFKAQIWPVNHGLVIVPSIHETACRARIMQDETTNAGKTYKFCAQTNSTNITIFP